MYYIWLSSSEEKEKPTKIYKVDWNSLIEVKAVQQKKMISEKKKEQKGRLLGGGETFLKVLLVTSRPHRLSIKRNREPLPGQDTRWFIDKDETSGKTEEGTTGGKTRNMPGHHGGVTSGDRRR